MAQKIKNRGSARWVKLTDQKLIMYTASCRIFAYVYSALASILLFTLADIYLGNSGLLPLPPTTLCIAILSPYLVFIFLREFFHRHDPKLSVLAVYRDNVLLIFIFATVVFFSLLFAFHPSANWREGGRWIFLYTYGFSTFLIGMLLPLVNTFHRHFHSFLLLSIVALFISMLTDAFMPGTFSTVMSRAAGFPGNANRAALIMVTLCAVALRYDKQQTKSYNILVLALGGVAVLLSMSRSGLLNFILLLGFYVYGSCVIQGMSIRSFARFLGRVMLLFLFVSVALFAIMENSIMFSKYRTRFSSLTSNQQLDEGSTESRLRAISESLSLIEDSPIFGHGTGYSRLMEELPHNTYLMQWVNNGIAGLSSYVLFMLVSFYVFYRRRFVPGMTLMAITLFGSFFSHNILDHRPFLILLGSLSTLSLPQLRIKSEQYETKQQNDVCQVQVRVVQRFPTDSLIGRKSASLLLMSAPNGKGLHNT